MKTILASGGILLALGGFAAARGAQPPAATPQPSTAARPGQPPATSAAEPPHEPLDWRSLEAPVLTHQVQLTQQSQFVKAGEAYFSPDQRWIIFQGVPVPAAGAEPDAFYSMYIAKLSRDESGRITGLENPICISPPGSANTCGWFNPVEPGRVIFGSTLTKPSEHQKSGFQVGTRKYVWMFPEEMEVCTRTVLEMLPETQRSSMGLSRDAAESTGKAAGVKPVALPPDLERPVPLFSRPDYDAECSYSADGRFVLYAHVREGQKTEGRADADIWVYDTKTRQQHAIVTADGYDGGPFFSPDGKRICYRSDRKLNDLLQLFVADLKLDTDGVPIGITAEHQITDNSNVNWAPFWHPSGKFLVYGTSEISHANYEVFAIQIDDARLAADSPTNRAADTLKHKRITSADGADVLPVFSPDGKLMMWTAQRGPMVEGESKPSSQIWVADFNASALKFD